MNTIQHSELSYLPLSGEYIDAFVSTRALSVLPVKGELSPTDVAFTIIPPTARPYDSFDEGLKKQLSHLRRDFKDSVFHNVLDNKHNSISCDKHANLDDSEATYFLPPGLLEDSDIEQNALLRKLDLKDALARRRPCSASYCLKARAYEITDALSMRDVEHSSTEHLFSRISSRSSSWLFSSSSSDCGSEDSAITPPFGTDGESNACSLSSRSLSPELSNSASTDIKPLRHGSHNGTVYFHASEFEGALLSDVKALKPGSLMGPDEDVMSSWGLPGCPAWIRIVVNQHGYQKQSVYIPTRCYCANITRARLAFDIASLLDLYFQNSPIRTGFENDQMRRKNIEGLYLHSLRRNVEDQVMVWRIAISNSAVSWSGKC
ncbi:hypothetical protein DXG01_000752 [Tephrocybe rancida]|nr:hypothetical protein DXG01_000752 [Tephrocybe rancida]